MYAAAVCRRQTDAYSFGSARDTYRWTPAVATAQSHDFYIWWSTNANRSATVPVSVVHSGGTATKTFDQRVNGGQCVLHGRYAFAAGKLGYVEMTETNGLAVANAVRFVPVTDGGGTTITTQKGSVAKFVFDEFGIL